MCNFGIDWPPILLVGAGNWVQPKKIVGACLTLARVFKSPFAPLNYFDRRRKPLSSNTICGGARVHARGKRKFLGLASN
jgi:hypothetical protein